MKKLANAAITKTLKEGKGSLSPTALLKIFPAKK